MKVCVGSKITTAWYQAALHLHRSMQPNLHRSRRPIRRSNPLSTADWIDRTTLPRIPEYYAPIRSFTWSERRRFFANITALRSSVQSNVTPLTSDDQPVCLDSGASLAVSNNILDFDSNMRPVADGTITGIGADLQIVGIGEISWTFISDDGDPVTIKVLGLYVPKCPMNLLPPQQLLAAPGMSTTNRALFETDGMHVVYDGHPITFPYDAQSNLPIRKLRAGCSHFSTQICGLTAKVDPMSVAHTIDAYSKVNTNLSPARRKLLEIHERNGHLDFAIIQHWANNGLEGIPRSVGKCKKPICASCQHGGMTKQPGPSTKTDSPLDVEPRLPGDFVATDQMISSTPGLMPFSSGRPAVRRYQCSTIFVDSVSKYVHSDL